MTRQCAIRNSSLSRCGHNVWHHSVAAFLPWCRCYCQLREQARCCSCHCSALLSCLFAGGIAIDSTCLTPRCHRKSLCRCLLLSSPALGCVTLSLNHLALHCLACFWVSVAETSIGKTVVDNGVGCLMLCRFFWRLFLPGLCFPAKHWRFLFKM
ncbi:hypothetical protein IscW_ISCW006529 [Ixodes scapularis]|uniref:Uncharacterized protein n=1 Tax=Ixodes scapularis TaxID=6945 RepID=B7PNK0_IXOSC|nr:hypothetical protein IscW_ISCW006529 [Ixodes scapularis]|eukprot:XP_002435348.1 hypothetical protein IscW_ISCW006529 [Ixodes scapularis]